MRNSILALVGAIILASCGGGGVDEVVTIKTSMGDMTVILYDETPMHKANFLKLAKSGKYDSTVFHRVINDFMIQGGDIHRFTGTQERPEDRIPAEFVEGIYHEKGALAAARQGDNVNPEKMSSSCQFYIVDGVSFDSKSWFQYKANAPESKKNQLFSVAIQSPENSQHLSALRQFQAEKNQIGFDSVVAIVMRKIEATMDPITFDAKQDSIYTTVGGTPFLDKDYTVFGKVVEGMDVMEKIAATQTGPGDLPINEVYVTMDVKTMSKTEITEKYGYEYPKK